MATAAAGNAASIAGATADGVNNRAGGVKPGPPLVQPKCAGGRVWNKCGSPCSDVACFAEAPSTCMTTCVARCQCPQQKPIWDPEAKQCVRSNDECIIPDASMEVTPPPPSPSLSPTPPSPPPSTPSPPKEGGSDQECLGDYGSDTVIVPLARQCPQDTPKCVGGVCTSVDWGSDMFCHDGHWLFWKPSKRVKDCKWVGERPGNRCKKKDAGGTKAKKICMAACNSCV